MSVTTHDRPTAERIGLPPFPFGWYRVASSEDVAPGQMISMKWLGQEMIAWRAESDGAISVFDAFCAHLGAHVGRGGFVDGDQVVCPFHHWRYDRTGRNVDIPYRDRPQRGAKLAAWPVLEQNGQILIWNGPPRVAPDWTPPLLPESTDPAFVRVEAQKVWTISTHVQEILENTVDVAHFQFVHGVSGFGAVELVQDGPMFRATAAVTMETPRGPVEGAVESELWGLGLDVVRQVGIGRARSIFSVTPIDEQSLEARHTFFVERDPGTGEPTRYGRGFMREFGRQILQDIPIWESKLYRSTPKLALGEGAIVDYRRWATQFYPAVDEVA